jgi:hypothetical protein
VRHSGHSCREACDAAGLEVVALHQIELAFAKHVGEAADRSGAERSIARARSMNVFGLVPDVGTASVRATRVGSIVRNVFRIVLPGPQTNDVSRR